LNKKITREVEMSSQLILGEGLALLTEKLRKILSTLPVNKVTLLNIQPQDMIGFLPTELSSTEKFYGLRIINADGESLPHSGWIFSHYLNACKQQGIDERKAISLYSKGFFREFGQLDLLENEGLFLAFGSPGEMMLSVVLDAHMSFNPDDFDEDGYIKPK
jgi:hypothetical protein